MIKNLFETLNNALFSLFIDANMILFITAVHLSADIVKNVKFLKPFLTPGLIQILKKQYQKGIIITKNLIQK